MKPKTKQTARPSAVRSHDWLADWAYRAARHIRNTDEIPRLRWGAQGCELLAELRDHDPERYDSQVKSANDQKLSHAASDFRQPKNRSEN